MKALKHISFVVIHCNMAMHSTHLKLNYSFFCQVQVILKVINYYCTMYSKIYVDNYFILRQSKKLANLLIFHNMKIINESL